MSGAYTDIKSICNELKNVVQDYDHNTVSINFMTKSDGVRKQRLNELDCSFMYTQMLKKIILTLDFNAEHFKELISYCRGQFVNNPRELQKIDKIEREYDAEQAILWYTYESCLYSMVNKALRMMDVELIVKMGFFIRDLHNHITVLYLQKYSEQNRSDPFTVFRGQGFTQIDFDHLKANEGGLLAFNNFLSTTRNHTVARKFAQSTVRRLNLVGVVFVITIDPSLSTTPFAQLQDVSYHAAEQEILFSMHSVFRTTSVQYIEGGDSLWQVELTLHNDNDHDLQILMSSIEDQASQASGWSRLGSLMISLAEFDKAQQLYDTILYQKPDENTAGGIYHYLGFIKHNQGEYQKALSYYEKALEIQQKALPANHPDLATSYNNIAGVYADMGEYSKVRSCFDRVL